MCPQCGCTIPDRKAGGRGRAKIYCSSLCARAQRNHAHYLARKSREIAARQDRSCRGCGATIPAAVNPQIKYCSPECHRRAVAAIAAAEYLRRPKPSRDLHSGTCEHCGTTYTAAATCWNRRFCSARCQGRARQGRAVDHSCETCSTEFRTLTRRRRYCKPCLAVRRVAIGLAQRKAPIVRRPPQCRDCAALIESRHRYCIPCLREHERQYGLSRKDIDRTPTERECLACGRAFTRPTHNRTQYCSTRCANHLRKTRSLLGGGPIPVEMLPVVRLYREVNKELQSRYGNRGNPPDQVAQSR